uniref:Uncharacterized protein n=1 Tax=viral metagenome TaxID=1070528 RepID=A0A6C0E096_9ZZZZ
MNTFHGIDPQLITNTTLNELEASLNIEAPTQRNKIFNGLGNFYSNYIAPNLFSIIVIVAFATYLIINYVINKEKITKRVVVKHIKEEDEDDEDDIDEDNISNYISDDYLLTETE